MAPSGLRQRGRRNLHLGHTNIRTTPIDLRAPRARRGPRAPRRSPTPRSFPRPLHSRRSSPSAVTPSRAATRAPMNLELARPRGFEPLTYGSGGSSATLGEGSSGSQAAGNVRVDDREGARRPAHRSRSSASRPLGAAVHLVQQTVVGEPVLTPPVGVPPRGVQAPPLAVRKDAAVLAWRADWHAPDAAILALPEQASCTYSAAEVLHVAPCAGPQLQSVHVRVSKGSSWKVRRLG